MVTAVRGDISGGWIAVDDFVFLADVENCDIVPPEADPGTTSTTDSGGSTQYPPSK